MISGAFIDFCDEFNVIEKSIEVVVKIAGEPKTFRIDVVESLQEGDYFTRGYVREYVTVQPADSLTGNRIERKPEVVSVWVDYKLPEKGRRNADEALNQALEFLHATYFRQLIR
jgi:hypothetical protein